MRYQPMSASAATCGNRMAQSYQTSGRATIGGQALASSRVCSRVSTTSGRRHTAHTVSCRTDRTVAVARDAIVIRILAAAADFATDQFAGTSLIEPANSRINSRPCCLGASDSPSIQSRRTP